MRIHSDDAYAAAMEIMGVDDQHPQHHSDDGARGVAAVVACATRDVVDDDNDAADAGPAIARDGPGPITTTNTTQHHQPLQQPQAPTTEQQQSSSSSSSSPPPAGAPSPSAVPSILSGAPSWLFAHPLMSTLFGDQHQAQQQRRAGESSSSSSSGAISASTTAAPQLVVSLSSSSPPPSSSSITTPILAHDRHRGRSDDVEEEPGHYGTSVNDKDSINVNKATNVIALTRTHFSSPESRRYHALHNDNEEEYIYQPPQPHSNNDDIHHGSMAMMGRHFGTFSTKNEDATTTASSGDNPKHNSSSSDLFLTHTYPLTLQRSASSAFGCPYSSTTSPSSSSFCTFKTRARVRTLSNSGYSDPGASAFRPVWSKSSSSSSNNDVGSDVGSTISSSIAGATVAATTHSDPLSDRTILMSSYAGAATTTSGQSSRAYYSPWRRVMNRMKKGNYYHTTSNTIVGGSSGSSEKGNNNNNNTINFGGGSTTTRKLRRRLSGRENPNAAGLEQGGEDDHHRHDGAGGGIVGVIASLSELHVEGSLPTTTTASSSLGSESKKAIAVAKAAKSSAAISASSKKTTSSVHAAHDNDGGVCDVELLVDNDGEKNFALLIAGPTEVQYDDPGVALDLSDDSDNDDEVTVPPFLGNSILANERMVDISSRSRSMPLGSVIRTTNQKRNTKEEPSPPIFDQMIPCDSVEVTTMLVSESILGSVRIIASDSIDENSPPSVERVVVCENADNNNFPYHPLSDSDEGEDNYETEQGDVFHVVEHLQGDSNLQSAGHGQLVRMKYRSPQRASRPIQPTLASHRGNQQQTSPSLSSSSHDSPGSRYSSVGGSPESRISSSNSRSVSSVLNSSGDRTINTEGSLVADIEVREANRRPYRSTSSSDGERVGCENNHEVVVGPDGSETVFSSSTASSTAWPYVSSPRTLRDGATMPVERFFAGGNVAMSPSPQQITGGGDVKEHAVLVSGRTTSSAPINSKLLIPKKLSKKSSGGTVGSARDLTHSPHTVSSNSVSANSSSSSETKKPLQFVAYEFREERESPFDEPPVSGYDAASGAGEVAGGGVPMKTDVCMALIKPRISKLGDRPPMVQRPSAYIPVKPPQSPRRSALLHGRARTPTRTPPPLSLSSSSNAVPRSGSSTPSSPPVIIDGPSNAGTFWIPQHPAIPPRTGTAALAMSSQLRDDELMVDGLSSGANKTVQDDLVCSELASGVEVCAPTTASTITGATIVSPEKSTMPNTTVKRLHNIISPKPEWNATNPLSSLFGETPTVSPEKGF